MTFVYVCLCVCPRSKKNTTSGVVTPKSIEIESMAGHWHALIDLEMIIRRLLNGMFRIYIVDKISRDICAVAELVVLQKKVTTKQQCCRKHNQSISL